ncbi:MAG: P27 family phage terminase small subunit [Actinomycetota bacterium]|nr:P27 family phage terminase small subunit [Actinomycetota bacterium]
MPLSSDPAKRSRQLANLTPGAGSGDRGDRRALSHGAYSQIEPERLDSKVREVLAALTADAPVREVDGGLPAADGVAVRQLAEALARLDTIAEYLGRRGWEDESGKPRPVLDYEGRLRSHVLELLKELGMTPASRAKLGLDLVRARRTLDDELAAGRDAWERREAIDGTAEAVDRSEQDAAAGGQRLEEAEHGA